MKKIVYFTVIMLALAGCNDAYYSEGRVETVSVTEITNESAMLNGSIDIAHEGSKAQLNILHRGFKFGTASNNLNLSVNAQRGGSGAFSCNATGLMPNTKYYVMAFASIEYYHKESDYEIENTLFYGNVIEFTTAP
jgi:hypothetical protein